MKVAWRCNTKEPAHSGHPNPGALQSGHSPAPFITIEGDDGQDYEAERKPPITVNNVVSACGKDYMRKSYPGGRRHAFWGRMECGLVLSSVSPWEMVHGARAFGRERWGAPAFFKSPRAMWSFRWSWMSLRSDSTTDG